MEDKSLEVIDLETSKKVKLVGLMDPFLCVSCDQVKIVMVRKPGERPKKMFYCQRLDCDNWEISRIN